MQLSSPVKRKTSTPPTQLSTFGKPTRSPRTPTPSSLTHAVSYSDTFENVTQSQSVQYSDTFETDTKPEQTTIKTAKFTTIATEIEMGKTTPDLTKLSESFPTYSDTFDTEPSSFHQDSDAMRKTDSSTFVSDTQHATEYTEDDSRTYSTRTLESVAKSSTDRYSSDEFEEEKGDDDDDQSYTYSESYDYSSTFEPVDDLSSIAVDSEMLRKEEEIKRVSEEARENYIAQMISNIRNRKFKDTDITELSVIEPLEAKPKLIEEETDSFSQRYLKKKLALLKHKKKYGNKPLEEKPWPGQRDVHVTEYGLHPEIVEKLKIKNLIIRMEKAVNDDMHDPKRCRDCREYERQVDEEAARRHFIRMKTCKIQKDITEKQYEQHMTRMNPVNLIGELAKSLPRPTTDPAVIMDQLNQGLTLSKYL